MANTKTARTYAVVPSRGRYEPDELVEAIMLSDDLERVVYFARRYTREYQEGASSGGGYRVVHWGSGKRTIQGCDLDNLASV